MNPALYAALGTVLNEMAIGMTGSGKSEGKRRDVMFVAKSKGWAILFVDGKGSTVESIAADLDASGLWQRTDYEALKIESSSQKVLKWRALKPSLSPDPLVRYGHDELECERFLQSAYGMRNLKSGTSAPWIAKYGTAAVFVMLGLLVEFPDIPISMMLELFRFDSEIRHWMLEHTYYQEYAQVFRDLDRRARVPRINPTQWEIEAGAAGRLLKYLASPVVWTRSNGSYDWLTAIREKRIILLNGKDVPREVRRFLFISAVTAATSAVWDHYNQTGQSLNLLVVLEEAGADDLVTPHVITMCQEGRAAGIRVHTLSQSISDFGDDEKFEQLLANKHRVVFYRIKSGVDRAAKELAYPTWDAKKVLATRDIAYTAGYEEIGTKSVMRGPDGIERITEGTAFRPIPGIRVDEIFVSPAQHQEGFKQELTTNGVGQRHVSDFAGVRRETVEMLPDPWPFSRDHHGQRSKLYFLKLSKAIARMRDKPYYEAITQWNVPEHQPMSSVASSPPPQSESPGLPRNPTPISPESPQTGMLRSGPASAPGRTRNRPTPEEGSGMLRS